ncbi:MAG: TatD family hydrolase [Bacteroidia bacterium]|jgi:TatD DNase family protein|nr:TatD family hydrolase [Bacteroidota bacterium]MBP6512526.1 TatD family hydrolase [Bacteroidia bacterium]
MSKYVNVHTHLNQNENVISIQHVHAGELDEETSIGLFSVGFHPWYIQESSWKEKLDKMRTEVKHPTVLAIGESGLDKVCETPFSLQEDVFTAMIELSESIQKPLIIHCVRAFQEIIELHKKFQPQQPWIIHGFNRNQNLASSLLDRGIMLSFGAEVMKQDSPVLEVLKNISSLAFFMESDNKNISMEKLYLTAANIRNVKMEEMKEILFNNFKSVFKYAGS